MILLLFLLFFGLSPTVWTFLAYSDYLRPKRKELSGFSPLGRLCFSSSTAGCKPSLGGDAAACVRTAALGVPQPGLKPPHLIQACRLPGLG